MSDEGSYEVGFGKPPKATRFRKGRSGNPRGRPRGARGVKVLLDEALSRKITVTEGGRTARVSKSEALLVSLINKAIKGDIRAAAQVLRLMETHGERPADRKELVINVVDAFDDPA
ncbi:DUF5681 domain-containing protein [Palleronia abyssalis]|uniref:DUF5681 domain-containing protein n=1 Tax=Palleronia abyssalis TaxID=1501240 RepID=A0A2R8BY17_9RHOB|nr:DUF5681 domain-containing protein [Palleronia abyssalis]SPJ25041.1 hypothetical protein PAA8504_02884 [Palleronia abyssalis]